MKEGGQEGAVTREAKDGNEGRQWPLEVGKGKETSALERRQVTRLPDPSLTPDLQTCKTIHLCPVKSRGVRSFVTAATGNSCRRFLSHQGSTYESTYDGVRALHTQQTPHYFQFWILLFSQASERYAGGYALRIGAPRQPRD